LQRKLSESVRWQCPTVRAGAGEAAVAASGPAIRILVAEDNYVNQQLMLRVLAKAGYEVLLAGDGQEAVDLLSREQVDVVLMDCQMPRLDGYHAAMRIRDADCRARAGQKLPMIALTANAMVGDREKCLAAGMDDYVSKPITFSQLYDALARHVVAPSAAPAEIPTVRPAAAEALARAAALASAAPAGDAPREPLHDDGPPVIDREELWARIGGDRELLEILVESFRDAGPQHVSALQAAVAANDRDAARRVAHTLKGTAGNLSGVRLFRGVKSIEGALADGDLESARTKIGPLADAMNDLLEHLERLLADEVATSGAAGTCYTARGRC
jgi:CheY-like chemotaxis protein/HPt (histidine-containing phosphotransfer) domain-containing protein